MSMCYTGTLHHRRCTYTLHPTTLHSYCLVPNSIPDPKPETLDLDPRTLKPKPYAQPKPYAKRQPYCQLLDGDRISVDALAWEYMECVREVVASRHCRKQVQTRARALKTRNPKPSQQSRNPNSEPLNPKSWNQAVTG
jgi:hypothetical protein